MLIPYPMNIGTRFLIPSLTFFALAMTIAIASFPRAILALALIHAILSWPTVVSSYAATWRIVDFPLQAALRRETEVAFLRRTLAGYDAARMIEEYVPPHGRVLSLAGMPRAYTSRDVLIGYEASLNSELTDALYTGFSSAFRPVVGLTFQFPEQSARRIRVLQTGRATHPHQWNITELRFLDNGEELLRSPAWRVRAWPNPWSVQLAFDNSPATRWRSSEPPSLGMWVEADFGEKRNVNQVEIQETVDEVWSVTIQVETMDDRGKWIKRGEVPKMHELSLPKGLRRAATHEIYSRGIHYILAHDSDFGGDDYADDPNEWGMRIVARSGDANLYRILP